MSLAEVLDVLPVMQRRVNVKRGVEYFVISIALGKCVGSVLYFTIRGFSKN